MSCTIPWWSPAFQYTSHAFSLDKIALESGIYLPHGEAFPIRSPFEVGGSRNIVCPYHIRVRCYQPNFQLWTLKPNFDKALPIGCKLVRFRALNRSDQPDQLPVANFASTLIIDSLRWIPVQLYRRGWLTWILHCGNWTGMGSFSSECN
jgi:hypothetical protein